MSKNRVKNRINKFIFQEGSVFLRLKATAENLVCQKNENGYSLVFANKLSNDKESNIHVTFVQGLAEVPSDNIIREDFSWGELIKEKSTEKTAEKNTPIFYYVIPDKCDYAAKVGPFTEAIINSELEIDWENIQWGSTPLVTQSK